jgi:hypothetical protein
MVWSATVACNCCRQCSCGVHTCIIRISMNCWIANCFPERVAWACEAGHWHCACTMTLCVK